MFKQVLLLNNSSNIDVHSLKFLISWKFKEELVSVINKFIKDKTLIEFYPLEETKFITIWDSKESFNMFESQIESCMLIQLLKSNGVQLSWFDMEV